MFIVNVRHIDNFVACTTISLDISDDEVAIASLAVKVMVIACTMLSLLNGWKNVGMAQSA